MQFTCNFVQAIKATTKPLMQSKFPIMPVLLNFQISSPVLVKYHCFDLFKIYGEKLNAIYL
jgi:hypothetical protein